MTEARDRVALGPEEGGVFKPPSPEGIFAKKEAGGEDNRRGKLELSFKRYTFAFCP